MSQRMFHTEDIRVKIRFGDAITNLAIESNIQLILRHCFEDGSVLVRFWEIRIEGHVQCSGRD